jgi:hypothetical protein
MRVGNRVLVRPFLRVPVRPWWAETYQSPFYYPATVTGITANDHIRMELDDAQFRVPWESRLQPFHTSEIHRFGCRCEECGTPGRDIPRFLSQIRDQE